MNERANVRNYKKHTQSPEQSKFSVFLFGIIIIIVFMLLAFSPRDAGIMALLRPNAAAMSSLDEVQDTYASPGSINLGNTPSTYHLDNFFRQFGTNIGIYYKNIETGFTYTFNPDTVFFAASLNKANYAIYAHMAAERGHMGMNTMHTFTEDDFWGGTGIIRFMPALTQFTTRELLHHSVVYSDNIAHRMLVRYMSHISFSYQDFVAELGANPSFIGSNYANNTNAYDTGLWFYALYNYFESDMQYSHYLLNDMLNTTQYSHPYFTRGTTFGGDSYVNVQFIHSNYPTAQKYGWAIESFNVAGIIYAPSPFILVIISDMDYGAHDLFKEISLLIEEFNGRYF